MDGLGFSFMCGGFGQGEDYAKFSEKHNATRAFMCGNIHDISTVYSTPSPRQQFSTPFLQRVVISLTPNLVVGEVYSYILTLWDIPLEKAEVCPYKKAHEGGIHRDTTR